MVRRDAEAFERDAVLLGAVARVAFPPVSGMVAGEPFHDAVARHLGDDRRRRNGEAEAVAGDNGAGRHREGRRHVAVDQRRLRRRGEGANRTLHGDEGGPENIQAVDLGDLGDADADVGAGLDFREKRFADGALQLLGIVEARGQRGRQAAAIKYRRCRDDRTGPWPAARFVDPGDAAAHFRFEFPARHSSPASRTVH